MLLERMGPALRTLGLSLWFGGGLAVLVGTRALFRVAGSRKQGGQFSGALLQSFVWLRLLALFAVCVAVLLGPHQSGAAVLLAALFVAGMLVDARLRKLRDQIGGSTEGLEASDPRRKRFGSLHGLSVLILIGQILVAAAALLLAG